MPFCGCVEFVEEGVVVGQMKGRVNKNLTGVCCMPEESLTACTLRLEAVQGKPGWQYPVRLESRGSC